MSAFESWCEKCEILEEQILSLFVGIFAGVNECIFSKFVSFWVGFLRILWSEVMNNYGVPEICVFLGWILAILWSKVTNNYGVPKIRVFLHPEMFEFHVVGELSCWGCKLE